MLMVIFGAGASYDSFPSAPAPLPVPFPDYIERPPLASQLFERRDRFRDFARQYPKCLPLIAELEPRPSPGVSVEEFLEQYQSASGRGSAVSVVGDPILHPSSNPVLRVSLERHNPPGIELFESI
jgi:hypothetical protein